MQKKVSRIQFFKSSCYSFWFKYLNNIGIQDSICVKNRKETATISTLFYRLLTVWPIVMISQSYGKNIDNFVF